MPVEDRTRHDRLRSLLPRVYATDPKRHALGVLLEVLADNLREADQFTERALRDRWLRTATAARELDHVVDVGERPGWIDVPLLPKTMVARAQAEAATLGGRLTRLFAPQQQIDAVSLALIEILRPPTVVPEIEGDPAASLAALQALLAPLFPSLGPPLASDRPVAAAIPLQRARWLLAGELIEAAYAPAGPFTALLLIRGIPPESWLAPWRADLDAMIAGTRGLSDGELAPLPTIALDGPPHPLELLGAALDLRRQPWEVDVETYRNRVRILAPMLTEGLATPRVIVAAALTSLHAEPCPILERPEPDSTRRYGMPPRTLDRCRVCQGGRRQPQPGETCPMRARALMPATVTDNPRTRARLARSRLDPEPMDDLGGVGARLRIYNDSLFAARPQITLRAPAASDPPPPFPTMLAPRFRSLTTGEELIVPTVLFAGDELTLRPASSWQPERPRHRQVWVDPPSGEHQLPPRAWILRAASNTLEVVDALIMYAAGPRFGKARFAGLSDAAIFEQAHFDEVLFDTPAPDAETEEFRFATASLGVQAPALLPGNNEWVFSTLASADLLSLIADYDFPQAALDDLQALGVFPASSQPVALELSWWTRPPARFRVRVPRKPAVEQVLARGAAGYLRKLVDRLRPAGVYPIIDFAVEPITEALEPEVAPRSWAVRGREAIEPAASLSAAALDHGGEAIEPGDALTFTGVFDVTRFDSSRYAERGLEPAAFDRTVFDHALLHGQSPEIAELDESYFDYALLADYAKGRFGQISFDQVRFA